MKQAYLLYGACVGGGLFLRGVLLELFPRTGSDGVFVLSGGDSPACVQGESNTWRYRIVDIMKFIASIVGETGKLNNIFQRKSSRAYFSVL